MAGRTANISTSSFKPLSLQEIMMVPLAKQKMEDEFLTESDKYNQLAANVLDADRNRAQQAVDYYKSQASDMADTVIEKGVSRAEINKLRRLRGEMTKEFGQDGFTGNAIANKKAASLYMKNMSENKGGMAGGWSPREAQLYASKRIGEYKGAMNDDGSFSSFSPRAIAKYQDEDKFLKEAAEMVKGKVEQKTYDLISVGGLPAFYDAFQSREISGADYNTVMSTMRNQVLSSPEMIEHLKQRGEFNNEEDPLDLGKLESKDVVQKDGETKKVYNFVPGKSRFGQKMVNMGRAFSGKTQKLDVKFIKNDIRRKMLEDQYNEDSLVKMYKIQTGEYLDLTPNDIPEIRTINQDFDLKITEYESEMNRYKNTIMEQQGLTSDEAIKDPKYQSMLANYSEAKVGLENSNSYIKELEDNANSSLSDEDQSAIALESLIRKNNEDVVETAVKEFGLSKVELLKGYNKYKGLSEEEIPDDESTTNILTHVASRKLAKKYGINLGSGSSFNIKKQIKSAADNRDKIIGENLSAEKKGIAYSKVNMPKSGKYSSSKYRTYTDLSEEFLNSKSVSVLGGSVPMTIKDYMETSDFTDEMEGVDASKGFEFKKSFTIDGYTKDGQSFDEVIIRSKADPTKQAVIQVPSEDPGVKKELYESLVNSGDYNQRLEGKKGLANQIFMSSIKKSNLRNQESGSIFVDIPGIGPVDKIKFRKSKDNLGKTIWNVSMFDKPLTYAGSEELESEQEISLAMNKAYGDLMQEIARQEAGLE